MVFFRFNSQTILEGSACLGGQNIPIHLYPILPFDCYHSLTASPTLLRTSAPHLQSIISHRAFGCPIQLSQADLESHTHLLQYAWYCKLGFKSSGNLLINWSPLARIGRASHISSF
uniref:Uncharacterized protein n=1 Tax=Picea glauca TaxID=3330 RepID=A0A101LZD5_PICGL|nr:hypothetical protein ABT39_MTgene5181 [Picea glauca]